MKIILKSTGYAGIDTIIDKALNGFEAFQIIKKSYLQGSHSYGLIFMDCSMPIMDGFEATVKIRNYLR